MTDPKYAYHKTGVGRYYRLPVTGEEFPSITNILQTCVAKPALAPAAAKATTARAWEMLPRMVATSRKPFQRDELTKEIKGHYQNVWDQAADLGTRVHARIEAIALGKPHPDDPEVEPFALQALRCFNDMGVDLEKHVEATEATVINRTYGYAGTGDLWAHFKINGKRQLLLADFKTSGTRPATSVYPEYGLQVAALAHAEKLLLDNGEEIDPPGPIEGTAILNLRVNDYALIPMPLAGTVEEAFAAFVALIPGTRYLHSCYGAKPQPITKPRLKAVS
jgi:hypothetical protein